MARANASRARHGAARWWPPQGACANAVAAHEHRMQFAVFAVKLRGEGGGIFGAQFKHMAHFDAHGARPWLCPLWDPGRR